MINHGKYAVEYICLINQIIQRLVVVLDVYRKKITKDEDFVSIAEYIYKIGGERER